MVFAYLFTIVHQKLTQRCGKFDFNSIKKHLYVIPPEIEGRFWPTLNILEDDKKKS